eukprot:29237-Prymnesium_polylepis.2
MNRWSLQPPFCERIKKAHPAQTRVRRPRLHQPRRQQRPHALPVLVHKHGREHQAHLGAQHAVRAHGRAAGHRPLLRAAHRRPAQPAHRDLAAAHRVVEGA